MTNWCKIYYISVKLKSEKVRPIKSNGYRSVLSCQTDSRTVCLPFPVFYQLKVSLWLIVIIGLLPEWFLKKIKKDSSYLQRTLTCYLFISLHLTCGWIWTLPHTGLRPSHTGQVKCSFKLLLDMCKPDCLFVGWYLLLHNLWALLILFASSCLSR